MKKPFRERLKEGTILCDGAMGTLLDLYEYEEHPHEIQNLKNPDIVGRIHSEYIEAGAEIIETNTFSANPYRLASFHLEDQVAEINIKGAEIARRVAGDRVYVAGAVGPTGKLLEPVGKLKHQEVRAAFKKQIEALLKGGIDLIILETFVSLQELDEAIAAAQELSDLPIVAQKAFAEDGAILAGDFPIEVVEHIIQKGVDVVGANCTVGPQRMFSIIRTMYKDGVYLSAQPAAGIPTLQDGRSIYHATPEYLAAYARELVVSGVTLVGACCGSTPSHIRAIRDAIHGVRVGKVEVKPRSVRTIALEHREAEVGGPDLQSNFAKNLGTKFLKTVELDIPRGLEIDSVLEASAFLKTLGIDAIDITDGARARLRMSSITLSFLLQRDVGIEAMTHLATRDRNMIGLQAELLGAHALGLRNILCITGDPTSIGDYPHASSVFDVDAIGLIRAVKSMNDGTDLMGNPIGKKTSFLVACAANPVALDMELELNRVRKKVEAGAQVLFTQPVYEMKTLEWFLDQIKDLHVPLMLGILPLRSYKHAEFLHHEVPGIRIPDAIREQMRRAGDKASRLGVELAVNLLREAKPFVQGVYMMPPFKKYEMVVDILSALS
ncbi:MAG: bifunctional homocysteine S-methyltransferase/methylenetetrahydrofolate reductase [Bacteroidota bacterium]